MKKLLITGVLVLSLITTAGIALADDVSTTKVGWQLGFGRDNITDGKYASTLTDEDIVNEEGSIEEINTTTPPFNLEVKTDNETLDVRLGRMAFSEEFNNLDLKKDANVELEGFYRTFTIDDEDVEIFVPKTIKSGDKELTLRGEDNRPIWAGQRGKGNGQRGYGRGRNNNVAPGMGINAANCPYVD